MWKKWKESKFFKKLKQVRVNRAVYISAVVILLSLSVVLAITAANNRAKKDAATQPPAVTDEVTPTPDQNGENTPTPDNSQPTVNEDIIPELALPVSGKLIKDHIVDAQVFNETTKDWRVHLGIDIATAEDAPVCSVASGTVEQIWEDPMMGWCVAVTHAGDCVTVYKNLASTLAEGITTGAAVQKGQLLGHVGDSAQLEIAEEPHLHMEMTVKGLQVDPLDYFSAAVKETLSEDSIYEDSTGK